VFLTLRVSSEEISFSNPKRKDQMDLFNDFSNKENGIKPKVVRDLPAGPIFWEGWVKYFHYKSEPVTHPTSFFVNDQFFTQKALKHEVKKKDDKGYINIPTQFHFWSTLMINNLNLQASRKLVSGNQITENVDTMFIDNILPIIQGKRKGSIQDLGNFAEGNCVQVNTNKPKVPNVEFNVETDAGDKENWIICLETDKDKKTFLKVLEGLKFAKQERAEQLKKENPGATAKPTAEIFQKQLLGTGPYEKRKDHKQADGYFILLQDWSQCTLKCGGGKSYQHWMCVPPKKGGRACQGKPIRSKNCNTQPCPGHKFVPGENLINAAPELNTVLTPIIKSLPYTNRRQKKHEMRHQRIRCILQKEARRAR